MELDLIEISNQAQDFIQKALKLAQEDVKIAGVLIAITVISFLLILLFIQFLASSFQRKKRRISPYGPERIEKYNKDLSEVVDEGNTMVGMLENEIQENKTVLESLRTEVESLREERKTLKEEIRLMEESPTELADTLKRDNAQKLQVERRKGTRKAIKMTMLGLFLGFLITSATSGAWFYKEYPDTFQTEMGNLQTYVTTLWNKFAQK